MKLIIFLLINVKGFFKMILTFQVCATRYVQITQNNKSAISLQYLKKEVSDDAAYLHPDKHESLLQIDTMILMVMMKHFKSSQNTRFAMSLEYVKKEVRDEVDFVDAVKHQSFPQVDFNALIIKASYKVMLHY